MSIDRLNKLLRSWRRVKAPRGKFKHRHDRSPRQVEPLHDFFDSGPGLKIFEHNGNRHPRIFEHPRAADLSRDALDSRTLGPIEDCHIPALPFIVAGSVVFYHGSAARVHFPKNFPTPTRTSTVLIPGFGELNPAFEICR